MVAGPGRFTTRLMEATGGRVLGKEGAEGFYALAVRGPVALGIAFKIADGGERCRDGVVLDVLRQLGSLAGAELAELADLYRPALSNHRGPRSARSCRRWSWKRCKTAGGHEQRIRRAWLVLVPVLSLAGLPPAPPPAASARRSAR